MVGRPLRQHEQRGDGPFAFTELFYRRTSQRDASWQSSRVGRILKGLEHAAGLWALERLVIENRADIVHFQWLVLPFVDRIALGRLRRRCGLVLTVHNSEISTHSPRAVLGKLGAMLQSSGQKSAVLSFDRYIVHSVKTFNRLIELGIAPARIVRQQHPPLELRVESSPPKTPETGKRHEILFFGAIKPYKGVDVLIEAGIAMATKRSDFRITIAGQPFQSLDSLRARIAMTGADDVFRFDLDYVSEARLAGYLSAASVVVFPYREIDGSGALSHAVQLGKPIVASRVGGFAEPPFMDHIALVPPEDVKALAALLSELLDEPARLRDLEQKSASLRNLLPSWIDYAQACQTAYREIVPERVRV